MSARGRVFGHGVVARGEAKGARRWRPTVIGTSVCIVAAAILVPAQSAGAGSGYLKPNQLCNKLGVRLQASAGAQMFCFGPQSGGSTAQSRTNTTGTTALRAPSFGRNVNAANLSEDVSPSGVRAYGQSETSIAASGSYVVEAWNDATAFFTSPCDPSGKGSATGFGFSNDGGATFRDLGGLPNRNCKSDPAAISGDPSVEAYTVAGTTYFYIASIFIPLNHPQNDLSVTSCTVVGSGTSATLNCGDPTVAAISSDCVTLPFGSFCSFLDKEYLTIDPARHRLYMSYTEFGVSSFVASNGTVELAVCDLATPAAPACSNGSAGSKHPPYFVVSPAGQCEQEGAYPAVDPANGDVYVAWEYNWATNIFGSPPGAPVDCRTRATANLLARVPFTCLTLPASSCGVSNRGIVKVTSMDAAFVPGYNRFPASDFPRIAVSDSSGTVSIVWNDATRDPLGDIYLQSFNLGSVTRVQAAPVTLNNDTSGIALHFMPALRNTGINGLLNVSWYDRRSAPNSARTDVFAALNVDPRLSGTARSNVRVTDVSSDWNTVSSDIVPNFGDYTDNYTALTSTGATLHVAWSDGRLVVPQPFSSHVTLK